MNVFEFISGSPFISFFLAFGLVEIIKHLLIYCINRPLRAMNIRKHGWPPEHCDADGDFKPNEPKE